MTPERQALLRQGTRQCEAPTLADERCIRLATHTYQVVAGRVEYLCHQHALHGSPNTREVGR